MNILKTYIWNNVKEKLDTAPWLPHSRYLVRVCNRKLAQNRATKILLLRVYSYNASPNITRVIKSQRIQRAEHVARMRQMRDTYKILIGKLEG